MAYTLSQWQSSKSDKIRVYGIYVCLQVLHYSGVMQGNGYTGVVEWGIVDYIFSKW